MLEGLVNRAGSNPAWSLIADKLNTGRTGKSCRLRWVLRPAPSPGATARSAGLRPHFPPPPPPLLRPQVDEPAAP